MGSFCSCCSRDATTVSTNTSSGEDERQAMLDNASNSTIESIQKIKQLKTNTKLNPLSTYGSTSQTSYTPLKDKSGTNKLLNASHPLVDESKVSNIITLNTTDIKEKEMEHNISTSQTNLIICNAGYNQINGDYRWFVHSNKWCLFKETISYSLDKDIDVNQVYSQLKKLQSAEKDFRWDNNINKCWIISNLDQTAIYYAAPQLDKYNNYIPNDKNIWISVHGSLPPPDIYPNLAEQTCAPDKDETFGNIPTLVNTTQKSLSHSRGNSRNSLPAIDETVKDEKEKENDYDMDDEDEESVSDLD